MFPSAIGSIDCIAYNNGTKNKIPPIAEATTEDMIPKGAAMDAFLVSSATSDDASYPQKLKSGINKLIV